MDTQILYLVLIVVVLLLCFYIPKEYDEKMSKKYGGHIYEVYSCFACGAVGVFCIIGLLIESLVLIAGVVLLGVYFWQLCLCYQRCKKYGLSKLETVLALVLYVVYSIGALVVVLGIVQSLKNAMNRKK